jgi:hypothetical protein
MLFKEDGETALTAMIGCCADFVGRSCDAPLRHVRMPGIHQSKDLVSLAIHPDFADTNRWPGGNLESGHQRGGVIAQQLCRRTARSARFATDFGVSPHVISIVEQSTYLAPFAVFSLFLQRA